MKIGGLTKLTLLDYPQKVACTVFTVGCNFRCPFCHNAGLILLDDNSKQDSVSNPTASASRRPDILCEDEVLAFLGKRKNVLEGMCLTGGEPLLQNGVPEFLRKVKTLGYAVKLDTNGSFPEKLRALCEEKLIDYVAMDVKNSRARYAETAGSDVDIAAMEKSVEFLKSGIVDYEFRTTVVGKLHTEQSIAEIGEWLRGAKRLFLQKFEHSDSLVGEQLGQNVAAFACDETTMRRYRDILRNYVPETHLRGMDDN